MQSIVLSAQANEVLVFEMFIFSKFFVSRFFMSEGTRNVRQRN